MGVTVTDAEILEGVRKAFAQALLVDAAGIAPTTRVIGDLGADSLDLLGILFALQKQFGIKVGEGDFMLLTQLNLPPERIERDGTLTAEALSALRAWLPDLGADGRPVGLADLPNHITIATVCRMVRLKLPA